MPSSQTVRRSEVKNFQSEDIRKKFCGYRMVHETHERHEKPRIPFVYFVWFVDLPGFISGFLALRIS